MSKLIGVSTALFILLLPGMALALVNINTATLSDLQTLTGIGPTYAQRIIDARPFSAIADIKNVKGIGDAIFEKIKNDITVDVGPAVTVVESSNTVTSGGGGPVVTKEKKVVKPVEGLKLIAPDYAFVDQMVEFDVHPTDGTQDRLVRYTWNFGDAETASTKSPTHSYRNPGTYVVFVESYYLKETKTARHEIHVLPDKLTLTLQASGDVAIKNESDHEMDMFGMTLRGRTEFSFPKYSLLLPGETIVVKAEAVNATAGTVSLTSATGRVLATSWRPAEAKTRPIVKALSAAGPTVAASEEVAVNPDIDTKAEAAENTVSHQSAALPVSQVPNEAWPYLGLFGLISLGLFAVYGTKLNT